MTKTTTGPSGGRPMIQGHSYVVSSGHYLATEAGMSILRRGGSAFDAAAAIGFALTVTMPHQNGIGGEVPTLVYTAADGQVRAVSGHGVAPAAATLDLFKSLGLSIIPGDGLLGAVVPPALATWVLLLRELGTMRLADVLAPAVELAGQGFAMYDTLHQAIAGMAGRFKAQWPTSAEVFMPGGCVPACGSLWRQPLWAATFGEIIDIDRRHGDRLDGLQAAYDYFYCGPIAESIVAFCKNEFPDASGSAHAGLLTLADFAAYQAAIEPAASTNYRGLDVFKCPPWTQGPVMLQTLNILEGSDLKAMGHNSVAYIHTVTEAMKLAFADREFHYGDPKFVAVPMDRLLAKDYAAARRALIDPNVASMELRPGGYPAIRAQSVIDVEQAFAAFVPGANPDGAVAGGDTTKLEVIDAAGNMISATPSGGWLMSSPVVAGLGFPLGTRGQMFSLTAGHPNCLAPGKRPRTTLTPSIATRGGGPCLSFGSPGGDSQDQWALQFLLNVVEFGMSLQEAVEAPTFWTNHFPSSFHPRKAEPGSLHIEGRVPAAVRDQLAAMGHIVKACADWSGGNTLAVGVGQDGLRQAAASPRLDPAYAAGW